MVEFVLNLSFCKTLTSVLIYMSTVSQISDLDGKRQMPFQFCFVLCVLQHKINWIKQVQSNQHKNFIKIIRIVMIQGPKQTTSSTQQRTSKKQLLSSEYPQILQSLKQEIYTSVQKSFKDINLPTMLGKQNHELLVSSFTSQLDEIYHKCSNNVEKFIEEIQGTFGQIYFEITQYIMKRLNSGQICIQQAKVFLSNQILSLNITVLKFIGQKNNHHQNSFYYELVQKFQNKLAIYMKTKYPKGKSGNLPNDFINKFQQFDKSNDFEFDILRKSNTFFNNPDQKSIVKTIKHFLNKIIRQCNQRFPDFERLMKEKAFKIPNKLIEHNNLPSISLLPKIVKKVNTHSNYSLQSKQLSLQEQKANFKNDIQLNQNQRQLIKDSRPNLIQFKELNYTIGQKIDKNCHQYNNFESQYLAINSPQIFRVLIKWMDDLEEMIKKPQTKFDQQQNFKRYLGIVSSEKLTKVFNDNFDIMSENLNNQDQIQIQNNQDSNQIYNDRDQDDEMQDKQEKYNYRFQQANEYEFPKIYSKYKIQMQQIKPHYQKTEKRLLKQLSEFNSQIIKLLSLKQINQKYIPRKQAQIIKYTSFNKKFIEYILIQKLVFTIKSITEAGMSFGQQRVGIIDLVKFRITDLLRCQVTGDKSEILEVYQNFINLEAQGLIDIIKIKNKLNTPLCNVMIMFCLKNSFIVCEAQLTVSQKSKKTSQSDKNIYAINHYFYQLERSPYGILSQVSLILADKDPKVKYQGEINFKQNTLVNIQQCKQNHFLYVQSIQIQIKPFLCSKCFHYYEKFHNILKYFTCKLCQLTICSQCIIKGDCSQLNNFLTEKIQFQIKNKLLATQNQISNVQQIKLKKSVNIKRLLENFQKDIFVFNQFFVNHKKIKFIELHKHLLMKYPYILKGLEQQVIILFIDFSIGKSSFKTYFYLSNKKYLQNSLNRHQRYTQQSTFTFSSYGAILLLKKSNLNMVQDIKTNHLWIFHPKSNIEKMITKTKKQTENSEIKIKRIIKIISVEFLDQYELVLGTKIQAIKTDIDNQKIKDAQINLIRQQSKKLFNFDSLDEYLKGRKQSLKNVQSIVFNDLGLSSQHLCYFKENNWTSKIKELKLTKNKIREIDVVIENCHNLIKLYLNQNYVRQLNFKVKKIVSKTKNNFSAGSFYDNKQSQYRMLKLEVIVGTNNQIDKIRGLTYLQNLRKLDISENNLRNSDWLVSLPTLRNLNIDRNYLSDFQKIISIKQPGLEQFIFGSQKQNVQLKGYQGPNLKKIHPNANKIESKPFMMSFTQIKTFECYMPNKQNLIQFNNAQFFFQKSGIQKIIISDCLIKNIQIHTLDLQKIKYLILNNNCIKDLSFLGLIQIITPTNTLQNQNQFTKKKFYCQNQNLIQLNLSNNKIRTIPILRLKKLTKLNLTNNRIKSIAHLSQSLMPQLTQLHLSANPIQELHPLHFNKLTALLIDYGQKLNNLDVLFSQKSSLQALNDITIQAKSQCDFSFNFNHQTNKLLNIRSFIAQQCCFVSSLLMNAIFEIQSLQNLSLLKTNFKKGFPILKIPNIKKLDLVSIRSNNFINLSKCEFASLKQLSLNLLMKKDDKFKCLFELPHLQKLSINGLINSIKDLQISILPQLKMLQIYGLITLDKAIPKISFKNLSYIDILAYQIRNLDEFIGDKMQKLVTVRLNSCQIQNVSSQTIAKMPNIVKLELNNNKIKEFRCQIELSSLKQLKLRQNKLNKIPYIKAKNLQIIDLEKNYCFEDVSLIQHYNNTHLKKISISNCESKSSKLPLLENEFLQELCIKNCNIKSVKNLGNSLIKNLKILNLSENKLRSIPFLFVPLVEDLNLSNNRLKNVQQLFNYGQGSTQKEELQKVENQQKFILSNVRLLDLSYNKIQRIQLDKMLKLQEAKLSNMNLCQFPILKGRLKQLKVIDISYNKVRSIPKLKMDWLTRLVCRGNRLQNIDDLLTSHFPQLTIIEFNLNRIQKIPQINFTSLKIIDFSQNPLTELDCFKSNEFQYLQSIIFNGTKVHRVQILPSMPKLYQIQICLSQLVDIQWLIESSPNLPSLTTFCATDNLITAIPQGIKNLTSLDQIYLKNNPIRQRQSVQYLLNVASLSQFSISLDFNIKSHKFKIPDNIIFSEIISFQLCKLQKKNIFLPHQDEKSEDQGEDQSEDQSEDLNDNSEVKDQQELRVSPSENQSLDNGQQCNSVNRQQDNKLQKEESINSDESNKSSELTNQLCLLRSIIKNSKH